MCLVLHQTGLKIVHSLSFLFKAARLRNVQDTDIENNDPKTFLIQEDDYMVSLTDQRERVLVRLSMSII